MNVANAVCDQLAAWDIGHVFGVSGANIELVFDAAARHRDVEVVLAKHEAAAAMMAMGYQQRSGRLGIVLTSSGGGAFNLVAPLTEALESRVPVLALVGQSPAARDGTGAFQDSSGVGTRVDAELIFGAVALSCTRVLDPADALAAVRDAAQLAVDRRGPAVVLLPRDVQAAQVAAARPVALRSAGPAPRVELDPAVVSTVASAVARPVPPLVIAGHGVLEAGARGELERLARRWGSPVAVTPDAKSAIDNRSAHFLGVAGVMGHARVVEYARRTSVCVLVGTRLPEIARFGLDECLAVTTLIDVNAEPCYAALCGHPDVLRVDGPTRSALAALAECAPIAGSPFARRARTAAEAPSSREGPLSSLEVMQRLARSIAPGSDVYVDAGNAGAFAVHHLPTDGSGVFSVALGMGAMGHAFGASIGAAVHTRRRTYVVAGDGAFFMHGLEVHTAVEYGLPITYVVLNNNAHAMCQLREQRLLGGATGVNRFAPAALAGGIGAMLPGVRATEIDSLNALDAALAEASGAPGPVFLSVTVPADEQPPFWPLAPNRSRQAEAHA